MLKTYLKAINLSNLFFLSTPWSFKVSNLLFLMFFLFACSDENNDKSSDATDLSKNDSYSLIEPSLLEKANLKLTLINQEDFEEIPYPENSFQASKNNCEASKGYNADQWEGLNLCSWAVEKEKINFYKTFVSRIEDQLILNTENGKIRLNHKIETNEDPTYYQFKDYISSSNYYLIEEITNQQCLHSKLISSKEGNTHRFKGTLSLSENGLFFIVYTSTIIRDLKCPNKIEFYEFKDSGIEKKWHLPLKNQRIKDLKFVKNKAIYIAFSKNNDQTNRLKYAKIGL